MEEELMFVELNNYPSKDVIFRVQYHGIEEIIKKYCSQFEFDLFVKNFVNYALWYDRYILLLNRQKNAIYDWLTFQPPTIFNKLPLGYNREKFKQDMLIANYTEGMKKLNDGIYSYIIDLIKIKLLFEIDEQHKWNVDILPSVLEFML